VFDDAGGIRRGPQSQPVLCEVQDHGDEAAGMTSSIKGACTAACSALIQQRVHNKGRI
jgi:hypothetical protein